MLLEPLLSSMPFTYKQENEAKLFTALDATLTDYLRYNLQQSMLCFVVSYVFLCVIQFKIH